MREEWKKQTADMPGLTSFVEGYVDGLLFTSSDPFDSGRPLNRNYSLSDIDTTAMLHIISECRVFLRTHAETLVNSGISYQDAGVNFAYTRNREGTGYWCHKDVTEADGALLTKSAHGWPETTLLLDQPTGKLYVA